MSTSRLRLSDLDELALSVRDSVSRAYVLEAINAYQGRAYRAAIVSLWVAVVYDIIAKIRELALLGDAVAIQTLKTIDGAISDNDVARFLRIEEQVLALAHTQFEFIARHELVDLQRLRQDRHLCAHPAFTGDDELFQPTPEVVRAHIVHAVVDLLQHQPVQGKSALDRMMKDISSATFPRDLEAVCEFLNWKYLDHAKEALIRNTVLMVTKRLLRDDDPSFAIQAPNMVHTLQALSRRHPRVYDAVMQDRLAGLADALGDEELGRLYRLLGAEPRCWAWISIPMRLRLQEHLRAYDLDQAVSDEIFGALAVGELAAAFVETLRSFVEAQRNMVAGPRLEIISTSSSTEIGQATAEAYAAARSFRQSERLGLSLILPMAPYFSRGDVVTVLYAVQSNNQIWYASGTPQILVSFFDATQEHISFTEAYWFELLEFMKTKGVDEMYLALADRLQQAKNSSPV